MIELTEREMADVGNRADKVQGSVPWCWQTITALQFMWENLEHAHELYIRTWKEAEEQAIWEKVPPDNPYGSKDAMLKALEIGGETAARKRVAVQAIKVKSLSQHGTNQHTKEAAAHARQLPRSKHSRYGAEYLTARIARDRPDIWKRMQSGEFKSVAEAARAAGIFKPRRKTVALLDDLDRVAANIKRGYTEEQVKELRNLLCCLVSPR